MRTDLDLAELAHYNSGVLRARAAYDADMAVMEHATVRVTKQLTSGQIAEAARMYASGHSVVAVAAAFNVHDMTMRRRLVKHGVVLRSRGRRRHA